MHADAAAHRPKVLGSGGGLDDSPAAPSPRRPPVPNSPSPAQSEASRRNGARSAGPASDAGKARAALNGVRHGLCGRTFFLLADEDPAEFRKHEALVVAFAGPAEAVEEQVV